MKLEEAINKHYEELNINDRVIIKQILFNKDEYMHLSSEELAKECHISRATLLRLCRKIGLNTFSDLKYLLKESRKKTELELTNFTNICHNYQLLINELSKVPYTPICKTIYDAETIYVYGTGNEQKSIAQELKRIFMPLGKCVIEVFDYGEVEFIKETFNRTDLFIIISLSGETKEGVDILQYIQDYIQTLSITRLQNNRISSLCNQNLYVATQKLNPLQDTSYELIGVFYALLDFLLVNYMEYVREQA